MKQIEIIIFMGLEDQLQSILEEEKIDEYFIIPKVIGKLKGSEPKLDTHIWPGFFVQYKFCLEDKKYESFRKKIEKKKKDWIKEGFLFTVRKIEERCGGS
ncbi:MAG: PG0541 family transporter-associated protein [candidate division WOR-3 bacterium]